MSTDKYFKILDERHSYNDRENRYEFVCGDIFGIWTYDSELQELFAKNMIEVLEAILTKTTFEYIAISHEKYVNYVTMCNFPFLEDKIEWGTSIRGAWFENYGIKEFDATMDVKLPKSEMEEWIQALLEWVKQ